MKGAFTITLQAFLTVFRLSGTLKSFRI